MMRWITFTVPNTRQREHHISISRTKSSLDGDSIVFFDVSGAACIRFRRKNPCEAQFVERCLACEADSVGTVEFDGLPDGNERVILVDALDLYDGNPISVMCPLGPIRSLALPRSKLRLTQRKPMFCQKRIG
jgi:hypothetical protein